MAARNALQFKGGAPRADNGINKHPDVSRKKFRNVLKECESLLKCMGVICIKGRGEAEATCAELNLRGMVNAVVSQDSDCFAYGARKVYRNFSVSSAAGGGATQGSVDCYDADKMFQAIGFGRNKMVALAMLCGCDYGVGACGSSIATVVSFLHTVSDGDIIPRLISWVSEPDRYDELTRWSQAPGRCDRCGHVGRIHAKKGCPMCATHQSCNDLKFKSKVTEVKRELSLRKRALTCGMPFPDPRIMKEFQNVATELIDINVIKAPPPSLIQFMKLMSNKLDWSERYCVEKFLPLLTKWHLQEDVPCRTIKPVKINKKRNPRGIPSYEVLWGDVDGQYDGLVPDEQFDDEEDPSLVWTTTERQDLMRNHYLELVDAYEESVKKPPKVKKIRIKKKKGEGDSDKPKRKYNKKVKDMIQANIENLSGTLKNLNLSNKVEDRNASKLNVSVSINKLKRKLKRKDGKRQKTIDSFISKKRKKSLSSIRFSLNEKYNLSAVNPSSDNVFDDLKYGVDLETNNKNNKYTLSMLDNDSEVSVNDLSDIIEKIVTRSPAIKTVKVNNHIMKLTFEDRATNRKAKFRKSILKEMQNNCSTPLQSPSRRNLLKYDANNSNTTNSKVNTSYFFDKLTDHCDAFEMSLDCKHKSAIVVDSDATIDYSLPDVCL
ncbi:hypothetical protein ACJJTC_001297 [Scirpophaga incertulas]